MRGSMPRMKTTLLTLLFVLAFAGTARAGGQPGSIGIGAEYQISGLGGISANYDAGRFHVGGFFGFIDHDGPDNTTVDIGGRFFFHVAQTAASDFSIGGTIGIRSVHVPEGNPNTDTELFIEPSFQIRAFVATNVALSFTAGISIGTVDADGVDITGGNAPRSGNISGNVSGSAGVHYYF